jgi:hypothetical protein
MHDEQYQLLFSQGSIKHRQKNRSALPVQLLLYGLTIFVWILFNVGLVSWMGTKELLSQFALKGCFFAFNCLLR